MHRYAKGWQREQASLSAVAFVPLSFDPGEAYAKAHPHAELRERTVWEEFETERACLVPYRGQFDGFYAVPALVSKTCLVRLDNNRYSVTASAVGRLVEIRAYAELIELRQDGRLVGEHPRCFGRDQTIYACPGEEARRFAQWSAGQGLDPADRLDLIPENWTV